MMPDRFTAPTCPPRLGACLAEGGVHFAVYSRHATAVDLCLYDPKDATQETARVRMTHGECDIWYAFVPKARAGLLYGYRAHGPWMPKNALRFNPNKLLLDPYSRAISGIPEGRQGMLGPEGPQHFPGSFDNGAEMLKSVVVDETFNWKGDAPPRVPWQDTIIYEAHVKGMTQLHPDVPKKLRGTYAGLAHAAVISHLRGLGVTSVQLLPVHAHLDDQFLLDKSLTNYWGYNTVGFFAPHAEYAAASDPQEQVREFKAMVRAFHAAGMEVILDVVYNHTAEGNEQGPTVMFRGLDDRTYYRQGFNGESSFYLNVTGCGNAVNSATPGPLRLIMDSLRYWVTEMHVDGFRFDLAVTVARDEKDNYNVMGQFLSAVSQDPILSQVKMIAEPWDIMREDSYQVGGFPEPWRELNGKYRDTVRRFWAGDEGTTAEFAKRLCGSQDVFGWNQRPALSSINFLTSHDGFTLLDLVSYASKHNEANGEDNRDGDNQNHSVSCGVEGPTVDPRVLSLRARLRRSLMATLMSSIGVPFINAGDELGRTQKGNNNAYCQDNEISWINWQAVDAEMLEFTRRMIALRKSAPALRRGHFLEGKLNPSSGLADVTWLAGNGRLLKHDEWHDPRRGVFGALFDAMPATGAHERNQPMLLLFNRGDLPVSFVLPRGADTLWTLHFDTSHPQSFVDPGRHLYDGGVAYSLRGRSVACLLLWEGTCTINLPDQSS